MLQGEFTHPFYKRSREITLEGRISILTKIVQVNGKALITSIIQ